MPNSGVFYKSGKFHVSKLDSDLVEFAGQVEATGIALADNQATGQGSESIVLPTATQVVDYVQQVSSAATTYELAAGSASSGESEAFAYTLKPNTDSEKKRLDDMFTEFAGLIAQAASSSETRDNTMQSAIAFIAADGTYAIANKLSATGIPSQTAVQAFAFPAPAQANLKADMEQRFDQIHSAFDSLAKASEDQDNVIEASVGLDATGAYVAPSWAGSALQVWDVTANSGAGAFASYSGSEITAATTVKEADELLRAMIQENNAAFTTLMAGNSVDFDTLKEIVDAYQLADTEVVDAVTKMAARIGLTLTGLNDGTANNETVTLADLAAVIDASGNASARGLGAIAYNAATMPSLKAMVEQSRSDISAHLVAMQTEMDSIETGAGLEINGSYVAPSGVQYLLAASSLKDADIKLDAEIKTVNERLSDKHGSESLLDYNIFDSQGASLPIPAVRSADFALSAGYNVVDALNELAQGSFSSITDLQAELDRTQASIGFDISGANTDGSDYSPALAYGANYFVNTSATSLIGELNAFFADAHFALKGFEGGTGLGHDGAYTANASSNYIQAAASLQDADNKLDIVIKAISDTNGMAANGSFVAYAGTLLSDPSVTDMKKADEALEAELLSIAGDLYVNPANSFGGFTIAGGTQSTFEDAINALDTLIGDDADLDVVADSGNGAVALATESYSLKGGATADAGATINIATSWNNVTKEMSISLDKSPNVEDLTADHQVSAPIMGAHVNVIQEGFEAAAGISAGDVICLNLAAYTLTQSTCVASVKVADKTVGASNDSRVVGIAFDKTSTQGSVDITKGFVAGEVVSFMTYGIMKGFDLSGCTTPAAGEELYLDSAGKVTNAPPSGDGSASTDYVSIHKIGMILKVGASAADCAVFIDMKHMANEA